VRSLGFKYAPIGWDYLTPQAYLALAPDAARVVARRSSEDGGRTKPAAGTRVAARRSSEDGGRTKPAAAAEAPVAAIVHGDFTPPQRPWPQFRSNLRPLDGSPRIEVLASASPSAFEHADGLDVALTDDFMIAGSRIEKGRGKALAADAQRLYESLLRLIADRGYPHLLRMWNILEDINRTEDGLERYRRFCVGRHEAFAKMRPDLAERYPAATAVGAERGGLCVYFIAARSPGTTIENPNQVSAFRYPAQYGPRSPSFSRALVKDWGGSANLFISGTASITGHETRHVSDLAAQAEKTADNLDALVRAAAERTGARFRLDDPRSMVKAYVRRAEDYPLVCDIVARRLGDEARVLYLRADICREALLVEIDGVLFA
jgi:chorismate lyase/3-hydroxybenzoate synthase